MNDLFFTPKAPVPIARLARSKWVIRPLIDHLDKSTWVIGTGAFGWKKGRSLSRRALYTRRPSPHRSLGLFFPIYSGLKNQTHWEGALGTFHGSFPHSPILRAIAHNPAMKKNMRLDNSNAAEFGETHACTMGADASSSRQVRTQLSSLGTILPKTNYH